MSAREGDFIDTHEGLIFDVKGLVHPPDRVIAYLRYLEDPSGDRRRGNRMYIKVYPLSDREKIIKSRYPQYLTYDPVFGDHLQEVPHESVHKLYQPAKKVSELLKRHRLDRMQMQALEFIQSLHDESSVRLGKMGLSGSILVDLHTESSDIDLVVYGRENCLSVYGSLKRSVGSKEGTIARYSSRDLERLYESRSKDTRMPLEDFVRLERRKFCQGMFRGRDFFTRFLLDWNEVGEKYGDRFYVPLGYSRIKGRVEDDSGSIFTPCLYTVSEAQVLEGTSVQPIIGITSFRGRFCEQAKKGETVIAQGKTEKVVERDGTESLRLVLGASPSDFMISRPA